MTVCATDSGIQNLTISKRHREQYRAARQPTWGDPWPHKPPS